MAGVVFVFCIVLLGRRCLSADAFVTRTLLQTTMDANVISNALSMVNGGGSASSRSSSRAGGEVLNVDAISESVTVAVAQVQGSQDVGAAANAAAVAIGLAYASAFAETIGEVTVDGNGVATANARAEAYSLAESTATAITSALAQATNGNKQVEAAADAVVIARGIAEAAASAESRVTTTGGSAYAVQVSVASAVVEPVAIALSDALAIVQNGVAAATAQSTGETGLITRAPPQSITLSDASANGGGEAVVAGEAMASAASSRSCRFPQRFCCPSQRQFCFCSSGGCYVREQGGYRDPRTGELCPCQ